MADKAAKREMFIEKRLEALAIVYLTRRRDLAVEDGRDDLGLDLIVRYMPEGHEGHRQFGVQLKGVWSLKTEQQADDLLRPSVRQVQKHGPFPFPVCAFLFAMQENKGWYTWVAEPAVDSGKAILRMRDEVDCKPLDEGALNDIVAEVDRWYDAFFENLIAHSPNGARSSRKQGRD